MLGSSVIAIGTVMCADTGTSRADVRVSSAALEKPRPARYNRTVLDAEGSAERFAVIRQVSRCGPVFLYGVHDGFTADVIRYVHRGRLPIAGRPDFFSMVSHEDAASAVVAALEAPFGIYNVVDKTPVIRREFGEALAQMLSVRP